VRLVPDFYEGGLERLGVPGQTSEPTEGAVRLAFEKELSHSAAVPFLAEGPGTVLEFVVIRAVGVLGEGVWGEFERARLIGGAVRSDVEAGHEFVLSLSIDAVLLPDTFNIER